MVGRNDPCPCGSGKKYKRCCWHQIESKASLPTDSDTRCSRVLEIYREIELITNLYRQEHPDHPCRIGCAECCYNIVVVYPEEFAFVQLGINHLSDDLLATITEKTVNCYQDILDRVPSLAELVKERDIVKYVHTVTSELEKIRTECPFLLDNKCMIYEYRPLVCRMYGIIHLFDPDSGRLLWTSTCSKLQNPESFGVPLPLPWVNIEFRTGIRTRPLPLIIWLILNSTNALDMEVLFAETMERPIYTPRLNHQALINHLIQKGIVIPPKNSKD